MSQPTSYAPARRVTILALDGGGVRGISSLLILQQLMTNVNDEFAKRQGTGHELLPRDIFDFVVGTSTGGLISIMMGKMGMSVEECIKAYRDLSSKVFGKKAIRGRFSGGLASPRYRASHLEDRVRHLLGRRGLGHEHRMIPRSEDSADHIKCSVVCREQPDSSRFKEPRPGARCICSTTCSPVYINSVCCTVCEAARATSAAWTYFPFMKIGERYFSDGGIGYNNPSLAIFEHYNLEKKARHPDRPYGYNQLVHGVDVFDAITLVNIGTGSITDETPQRKRQMFTRFVPGSIRYLFFLKQTLTKVATDSELTAEHMRSLADVSQGQVHYTRLSASNGVCWFKMDKHKAMARVEKITNDWLRDNRTAVEELAQDIAEEYCAKHSASLQL